MSLLKTHPEALEEFHAGKFVIHKTSCWFSAMAIDQYHEQNDVTVKESGGAIGLTTDPCALRGRMVSEPEIAQIVAKFEQYAVKIQEDTKHLHHKQRISAQCAFQKDI